MTRADMLINCSKDTAALMYVNTFFVERIVKIWNSLPAEEANFCNVKVFSNFLDKLDWRNYLST
jgi:hypothetical protein